MLTDKNVNFPFLRFEPETSETLQYRLVPLN